MKKKKYISALILLCIAIQLFIIYKNSGLLNFTNDYLKKKDNILFDKRLSQSNLEQSNFETDRYIVKYKNIKHKQIKESSLNTEIKDIIDNKVNESDLILTKSPVKVSNLINEIKKKNLDDNIEYIEPDYPIRLASDDRFYKKQWGIKNDNVELSEVTIDANIEKAWEKTEGEDVIVAVIDTGIDITHEDLSNNIWINDKEIAGNGIDDDENGFIDDVNGWNFTENNNNVYNQDKANEEAHATHVSGIIAGIKDNQNGITGVAPKAKILPLKVFNNGVAYTSDIINAIEYAEKMGVKIVNCSWGNVEYNNSLKEVIEDSEMLFICAAGNSFEDIDFNPIYPAAFELDNIISVASISQNGNLSSFSNFGEVSVDIAAPGEDILSTLPNNTYGKFSGTSMATAFVSGEAALLLNEFKEKSINEIKNNILESSDRISTLKGRVYRGNKINCSNAVNSINTEDGKINNIEKNVEDKLIETNFTKSSGYQLLSSSPWELKANMPTPRSSLGVLTVNNKIYAIGGDNSNKVEVFDPINNLWTTKGNMPAPRGSFGIATVNGKIYIIGGGDSYSKRVDEYDPITDTWSIKAEKPTLGRYVKAVTINEKIYTIDGENIEEYDPTINKWTFKSSLPTHKKVFSVSTDGKTIFVLGGLVSGTYDTTNTVEAYDISSNTWTTLSSLPNSSELLGCIFNDGQIYAIGGKYEAFDGNHEYLEYLNNVSVYDIKSNVWTRLSSINVPRYGLGVEIANGSIYAIGGSNVNGSLSTVESINLLKLRDDFGNDFIDAETIKLNTTTNASINYPGDIDFFKFTAPMNGMYTIQSTGSTDTFGSIYDNNKKLIVENDDSGDRNFSISINLIEGQNYYIKAKHYSNQGIGAYGIKVVKVDNEGNDFNTQNIIIPGVDLSAAIDYSGDYDFYKITPKIDGEYVVKTTGTTDTYGYLYDSNQILLSSNDDSEGRNFKITYKLFANKTYYIKIRHYSSTGIGSYNVNITRADTEGNDFSTENIITPGVDLSAAIDYPGDFDFFKITPKIDGEYIIQTKGDTDTYGYLYDNIPTLLASNDDYEGRNFKITYKLIANKTYYIKVKHYSSSNTGIYSLNVIRNDNEGNDFSTANIIELGRITGAAIDFEGDIDFYKFTPSKTDSYMFFSSGETDTQGDLYDDNKVLLTQSDNEGSGDNFKMLYKLDENKTYYLRVSNASANGLGIYNVEVKLKTIVPTIIKTEKSEFTLVISAKDIENVNNRKIKVTYDPNEVDVIDLCAITQEKDLNAGEIQGTNLSIKSFNQGEIVFSINNEISSGKIWSGTLNSIKFKSKVSNEVEVSYIVE